MKQVIYIFVFLLITRLGICQNKQPNNVKEIKQVLNTFMDCIVKKDSTKFYALFHKDPIVWIGVTKRDSYIEDLKKDSTEKEYFSATYKQFYRSISNAGAHEEKFYNIHIIEDGYVASVNFDYSFWNNQQKQNWGKEIWAMIKINGQWKITSVLFSLEYESIHPEPKRR